MRGKRESTYMQILSNVLLSQLSQTCDLLKILKFTGNEKVPENEHNLFNYFNLTTEL